MAITVQPITESFAAEIGDVDLARPIAADDLAALRAAFTRYAVLVFPDQHFDDASQLDFARHFGPLETTVKANPAGGTYFARQSNLDIATGAFIPPEDRRMIYQKANYFWHTDSSFKRVPSLCSLLSARIVPPEGGETEFATMRAAYDDLPEATKRRLDGLVALHSLQHSRSLVDPDVLTQDQRDEVPPVPQTLVRVNPVNGRKALYVGAHASQIVGWPQDEGSAFLRELTEFATQPRFVYRHAWRAGDLLVWDNRALLHRATAYDGVRYKRLMQRTTVAGDAPTVP